MCHQFKESRISIIISALIKNRKNKIARVIALKMSFKQPVQQDVEEYRCLLAGTSLTFKCKPKIVILMTPVQLLMRELYSLPSST